jgi:hypothetical protein
VKPETENRFSLRKRKKVDYQINLKKNDIDDDSEYEDEKYTKKNKKK